MKLPVNLFFLLSVTSWNFSCSFQQLLMSCSPVSHALLTCLTSGQDIFSSRSSHSLLFSHSYSQPATLTQVWTAKHKRLKGTHSWSINHSTEPKVSNFIEAVGDKESPDRSGNGIYSNYTKIFNALFFYWNMLPCIMQCNLMIFAAE